MQPVLRRAGGAWLVLLRASPGALRRRARHAREAGARRRYRARGRAPRRWRIGACRRAGTDETEPEEALAELDRPRGDAAEDEPEEARRRPRAARRAASRRHRSAGGAAMSRRCRTRSRTRRAGRRGPIAASTRSALMMRKGTISAAMRQAGDDFHALFMRAALEPLRAADLRACRTAARARLTRDPGRGAPQRVVARARAAGRHRVARRLVPVARRRLRMVGEGLGAARRLGRPADQPGARVRRAGRGAGRLAGAFRALACDNPAARGTNARLRNLRRGLIDPAEFVGVVDAVRYAGR